MVPVDEDLSRNAWRPTVDRAHRAVRERACVRSGGEHDVDRNERIFDDDRLGVAANADTRTRAGSAHAAIDRIENEPRRGAPRARQLDAPTAAIHAAVLQYERVFDGEAIGVDEVHAPALVSI